MSYYCSVKISSKHIVSLFTFLVTFLLFTSTTKAESITQLQKKQANFNYTSSVSDAGKISVAIVEEVSLNHLDQQNEGQADSDFQQTLLSSYQNYTLYKPVLNLYTKTGFHTHTKKQQLLNLIFPFHYFF